MVHFLTAGFLSIKIGQMLMTEQVWTRKITLMLPQGSHYFFCFLAAIYSAFFSWRKCLLFFFCLTWMTKKEHISSFFFYMHIPLRRDINFTQLELKYKKVRNKKSYWNYISDAALQQLFSKKVNVMLKILMTMMTLD